MADPHGYDLNNCLVDGDWIMNFEPEVTNGEPPTPVEPDPVASEIPPPPDLPDEPIVFAPDTFYTVTTVCFTADTGNGEPCRNLNVTATDSPVYSNGGEPLVVCGLCGMTRTILSAVLLDPQPERV